MKFYKALEEVIENGKGMRLPHWSAEVVSAHVRRKTKGDVIGGCLIYDASSPSNRTGIQFQI